MLVRRPGELTRRYIEGERAKFISPLALFLFSVFLLFAVVGQSLDFDQLKIKTNVSEARVETRVSTLATLDECGSLHDVLPRERFLQP